MATLKDLEYSESNNLIDVIIAGGMPDALRLMNEQIKVFSKGTPEQQRLAQKITALDTDMGKNYHRLEQMSKDFIKILNQMKGFAEMAKKAKAIFDKNPDSLADLSDDQSNILRMYWLRKKDLISAMFKKGYSMQELFS